MKKQWQLQKELMRKDIEIQWNLIIDIIDAWWWEKREKIILRNLL